MSRIAENANAEPVVDDPAMVVDLSTSSTPAIPTPSRSKPVSSEERIAEGLLRCIGRWGLAKTTIEDVARESGVSRATVYRLFPGGKSAILEFAARRQITQLIAELSVELDDCDELEDCIVRGLVVASSFLGRHQALAFMREHEPVVLEQVLGFDRLDVLLVTSGDLLSPILGRFLSAADASELGVWLARLLVSYFHTPDPSLDLSDAGQARDFVRAFVTPGLARLPRTAADDPDDPSEIASTEIASTEIASTETPNRPTSRST